MKVTFDNQNSNDRELLFDAITPGNSFFTYTVDGVSFIGNSADKFIIRSSYINNRVWAFRSLKQFHQLAHQYYNIDDEKKKYFLDIGANIGTTCISFYKKIDQNTKIIAFEPVGENYRLLKANALINNLPDDAYEFINKALGAKATRGTFNFKSSNTGAASVAYVKESVDQEGQSGTIDVGTLDEYVAMRDINPDEIKYIWIDTEGFEPEVLKGAEETLSHAAIPIFMEFTPAYFHKRANVETAEFVELLSKHYSKYVVAGSATVHEMQELLDAPERKKDGKLNQFDIFLIK